MTFRFDDPDQYVNGTPHAEFARLRANAPFSWHPASRSTTPNDGFWLATKHADVIAISKRPDLFSTAAPLLTDPLPRSLWSRNPALSMLANNLLTFDSRKHAAFRSIVNPLFAAGKLARHEALFRDRCVSTLERVAPRAAFDFATDVALPVATETVLSGFLGVPAADLEEMCRWVLTINSVDDPFFRSSAGAWHQAVEQLWRYGVSLLQGTRLVSSESVLGALLGESSLKEVTREELFFAFWSAIVTAAFDTTSSVIAGGVRALLAYPEQLERLRADPVLVSSAAEEIIRWVSPVVYFRRTATAATEISGQQVKSGQKIVLCYASANRDDAVFAKAAEFDVGRSPNNHVAFGYGPHFCLGARVATLVLRIFLEEFVRSRASRIQADGAVTYTKSAWISRIRRMPVCSVGV